ncbi:tRNA (N6-threonylcarbamoyladenosine(37)-N6)-methyltransferase TrmO [Desulfocurvibacter africanus]|uniref:tRNA (N6-threonylcarbamoyladenosine(37)-N6)-methyltransferase TrmO n=1 Tax=Desulfocurvibacter africanus TaxID=873 RepID=UPI002FDA633B
MNELILRPIGIVRSPWTSLEGMPIQPAGARDAEGQAVLDPQYAQGLADLEGFSHAYLIYHFHGSQGYALTVTPFLDNTPRGLFSTRAPRRPNPIGLSVVRVLGVSGNVLRIAGVDVLDGTPLLDIKPYMPAFDAVPEARAGWAEKSQADVGATRSDDRFAKPRAAD